MEQMTVTTPAETYERFYGPAIFDPCARILVDSAAPRPGEAVLDLACGTGLVARRVAPVVGGGGSITALDVNPGMLAVGRSLPLPDGAPIAWLQGDATAIDLPDETFDLVLCQQGLQFFSDRTAALRHVHRVVKTGGRVAFATWRGLDRHPLFRAMFEAEACHLEPLGVTHDDLTAPFSLDDPGELTALFAGAGFTDLDVAERSIEARFPSPETFVRNMEFAYAAVIPEFAANPEAFAAFVEAVEAETKHIIQSSTRGDFVVTPMQTHVVLARKP